MAAPIREGDCATSDEAHKVSEGSKVSGGPFPGTTLLHAVRRVLPVITRKIEALKEGGGGHEQFDGEFARTSTTRRAFTSLERFATHSVDALSALVKHPATFKAMLDIMRVVREMGAVYAEGAPGEAGAHAPNFPRAMILALTHVRVDGRLDGWGAMSQRVLGRMRALARGCGLEDARALHTKVNELWADVSLGEWETWLTEWLVKDMGMCHEAARVLVRSVAPSITSILGNASEMFAKLGEAADTHETFATLEEFASMGSGSEAEETLATLCAELMDIVYRTLETVFADVDIPLRYVHASMHAMRAISTLGDSRTLVSERPNLVRIVWRLCVSGICENDGVARRIKQVALHKHDLVSRIMAVTSLGRGANNVRTMARVAVRSWGRWARELHINAHGILGYCFTKMFSE